MVSCTRHMSALIRASSVARAGVHGAGCRRGTWGLLSGMASPSPPGAHPSVEITKGPGKQSGESAKGSYDIIGSPAVETPWSRRGWLELKTNWVSIFFPVPRERLNVRLLGMGG